MGAFEGIRQRLFASVPARAVAPAAGAQASKVAPRTYLIHGVDAAGSTDHGRGAMRQIASYLREHGYPEAQAIAFNSDSTLVNQLAIPREQVFGTFSKRLTKDILADLEARPLAPGQQVSLVGFSLGTKVAARVADNLSEKGVPVRTLALIEPRNGNTPAALSSLPKVGKVVLVENQADVALKNPYRDVYISHLEPNRSHLDMVEKPTQAVLDFLVDNLK